MKEFAWSWSKLEAYETCPKRYWHYNVAKDVKEAESENMRYGKFVHRAIELFILKGLPMPMEIKHLEKFVARFRNVPGETLGEQRLALNRTFQPTGWFDDDVYVRAIVDLTILGKTKGIVVDWKTGKMKSDTGQLELCGAMLLAYRPEITEIQGAYGWTKTKKFTKATVQRLNLSATWNNLLPRANALETAHQKENFPARPSGLCKKYCGVSSCPHHGE